MTATGTKEWSGDTIGNGPRLRPGAASAAMKAREFVRALDVRLAELRPAHNEVAPGSELGIAWMSLIGCVARTEMRADELLAAAQPFAATKNRPFVRRPPASG